MPSGTNIDVTNERIEEIEAAVTEIIGPPDPQYAYGNENHPASDMQVLISNIGVLNDWPAAYTPNIGPGDAFILVQLKGKNGRPGAFDYVENLRAGLQEQFPEVEFAYDTGGMLTSALNMGEPSPIHFQVNGSKLPVMHEIATIVKEEAEQVPGTVDVRIAQRLDYPTMTIKMNRDKAARMGITPEDILLILVNLGFRYKNYSKGHLVDPCKSLI